MIIKDEALDPYYIKVADNSYDLFKGRVNGKTGEDVETPMGYYTTLKTCLTKAAKLKAVENLENQATILEYVTMIDKTMDLFTEKIKY